MTAEPAGFTATQRAFIEVTRDPRIIPGLHHYCDEWCEMCPLSRRCLWFRCTGIYRRMKGRAGGDATFRSAAEATTFARAIAVLEGRETAQDVAGTLHAAGFRTKDGLASLAWDYAMDVSAWLVLAPDELRSLRIDGKPSSEEIILWFHVRIYLRVVRALAAREQRSERGSPAEDANGSAKVALIGVQRSRRAVALLRTSSNTDTVTRLVDLLTRVEQGIDAGFPKARGFMRPGFDVLVVG
jgi:hypothetical protein